MKEVSAVLITYNEAEKIERALASLQDLCAEILVVDSFSTDATPDICRRYASRFIQHPWQGYRDQKQFATHQARCDWILSLDADEEVSPELGDEIRTWKQTSGTPHPGYYIPRKTYFMGRWIEHTSWYPDWQLRLFRKSEGRWQGGRVHESFRLSGNAGRLRGHLYHYSYASLGEYLEQLERFSSLAAQDYFEQGRRAGWSSLLLQPPLVFFNNFVLRLGFLDGIPGLAVSSLSAISTLFKYLKLWELQSRPRTAQDR